MKLVALRVSDWSLGSRLFSSAAAALLIPSPLGCLDCSRSHLALSRFDLSCLGSVCTESGSV